MRHTALALAAVVLVAGPACGTSQDDPDEKAHATVETFLATCARGDAVAALDLLTEAAAADFVAAPSGADGCREVLAPVVPGDPPDFTAVDVVEARADAGYASVDVEGDDASASVELEQVRGVWQVAGTGG